MKSISNIGKNLPRKSPIRYLSLSGIDINLPMICLEAATSIASADEISSIAASSLVLYKMASNRGSSGNSNSSSNENIDANDTNGSPGVMRILYKETSEGIKWQVVQWH